jgi:hypothetical protein
VVREAILLVNDPALAAVASPAAVAQLLSRLAPVFTAGTAAPEKETHQSEAFIEAVSALCLPFMGVQYSGLWLCLKLTCSRRLHSGRGGFRMRCSLCTHLHTHNPYIIRKRMGRASV